MKKIAAIFCVVLLVATSALFSGTPVVVDKTGTDFQAYWYTGTFGKQITLDGAGNVHIAYCKTFFSKADTGYQVMYANVTKKTILPIPSQEPSDPIQPGMVFIGGGTNNTPVYLYYGVGNRMYGYGPAMHLQAMAKVSADGKSIVPLGLQKDKNYYHDPHYSNPIAMEVDEMNGICHIIQSNPTGAEVAYWNFDGTNFGEIYNVINKDAANDIPGHSIPGYLRRNATKGADLAVSSDGMEVTIATLHPFQQIFLHKGALGGEVWADNYKDGLADGTIVGLFDTDSTKNARANNIPNNDPKPYLSVQVKYDDTGKLHVVYDATYMDVAIDTSGWYGAVRDDWSNNYSALAGDKQAVYYDGTAHPKPQLRYWTSKTGTHKLLAECQYPLKGQKLAWYDFATPDSGLGAWGKWYSSGPIENMDLVVNANPKTGEPQLACVWEEMQGDVKVMIDNDRSFAHDYYAFHKDLKISVSTDGTTWSTPVNLTKTDNLDETSVSVYKDIVNNKIHMMYYRDNLPGLDRVLSYVDDMASKFYFYTGHQGFSVPIRVSESDQVEVMYQEVDLASLSTGVADQKAMPGEFALAQNYPNPFNPSTEIVYTVPAGQVTLEIYNVLGQKVKTLIDTFVASGTWSATWDGTNAAGERVTSGMYLYQLKSDAGVKIKKMMYQK
jgi:hypothetical protein